MHGYLRSSLTKKRHYLRHYCYHDVRRDATMQKEGEHLETEKEMMTMTRKK